MPTQVGSYFTRELDAGAGIVITASHNPWTDNGFKVKADTGGAAAPEMLAAIEATMDTHPEDELPPRRDSRRRGRGRAGRELRRRIRSSATSWRASSISSGSAPPTGACWSRRSTARAPAGSPVSLGDGRLTVRELHTERNPFFGGVNPEPIRPNVDEWLAEIPRWGADIGIAFDGDADRVGMATEEGVFVNQLQVYGLLYWYLLDVRGQIGPAVYTVTTTTMAKRLAEIYGTQAYETGVGFKFVGPKMTETDAVIGGEESGGFGFGMHIPERDGIASGLFLLDLWLTKGKRASEVLAELQALAGPSHYNRIDIRFAREGYDAVKTDTLARLAEEAPEHLAGQEVIERVALETKDGFKFYRSRRLVAPHPLQRNRGAPSRLRRGALAGGRRGAPRRGPDRRRRSRARRRDLMDARDFFGYKNPDEEPGRPDPADETTDGRPPLFEDAVTLDDPATLQRIDPEDMLGKVAELPAPARPGATGGRRRRAG